MIETGAVTRNEDWLRTVGWDLPAEWDEFVRFVGGPSRLAEWVGRPALEAAPPVIVQGFKAHAKQCGWDPSILGRLGVNGKDPALTAAAWDESLHPRDERGRFGQGTGGGETVTKAKALPISQPPGPAIDQLAVPTDPTHVPTSTAEFHAAYVQALGDRWRRDAAVPFADQAPGNMAGTDLWRYERGMADDLERQKVEGYRDGDPKALAALADATSVIAERAATDQVPPEYIARVQEIADTARANDALGRILDARTDGVFPAVFAVHDDPFKPEEHSRLDNPVARYIGWQDSINMYDSYTDWDVNRRDAGPDYRSPVPPASGPLSPDGTLARADLGGQFQHELGHHVEDKASADDVNAWAAMVKTLPMDKISYYASSGPKGTLDQREAWAETFTSVMSPDYRRDAFDAAVHPALEWMENYVGAENVGKGI